MECINIALAKGRLADKTVAILKDSGIFFSDYSSQSRKLIFTDDSERIRLILVKAGDVPIYVERGASDIGVAGKDTLLECGANLYEIMDLGFGRCRFAVAALTSYERVPGRKLRVATKYPAVAKEYYSKKGEPIEIIKLTGSVELAPVVGLSDVIVDIVETGSTLKENGLCIIEEICDVSARLVVNKASFKTKNKEIEWIVESIGNAINKLK